MPVSPAPTNPLCLPMANDTYRTLAASASAEHKVEDSRFVAEAAPVSSRGAAEEHIEAVRARKHKARHHCSAYRIGTGGDVSRYDDDGEPSGTGGRPLLRVIDARTLTNTVVVVTRYFGGTELGTGGLARAYGTAADRALDRASVVERVVRVPVRIEYAYDDTAPAEHVLRQFDTEIQESTYTETTALTVGVRHSAVDEFVEAFTNALGGRGTVRGVGE